MSQISIPHSDNNFEQFRCQRFTHLGVSHGEGPKRGVSHGSLIRNCELLIESDQNVEFLILFCWKHEFGYHLVAPSFLKSEAPRSEVVSSGEVSSLVRWFKFLPTEVR